MRDDTPDRIDALLAEIATHDDWADLWPRFPLQATAHMRHDWYLTTGRVGDWVIPDWAAVSAENDAVHLQIGAYFSAEGNIISSIAT